MAKMKDTEVREMAMALATEALKNGTFTEKVEPAGKQTVAFPCEIDIEGNGEPKEVWVKFVMSVPHWKRYNSRGTIHEAYNPFEDENEWQFELNQRRERVEKAKANKEKKIAKQNALKAKG
jgi:hypothetical protein